VRKIHEDGTSFNLPVESLPQINWTGKDKAFVSSGSVLLPGRGGYFKASYLVPTDRNSMPVVVSSQFLILTPTKHILAEFLCWILNQPAMQRALIESSQGTSMPMLRAETLKQLKIAVPSLKTQQQIIELNRLWEHEQDVTQALLKNRENMLKGVFQQLLKETS
ncbi:MAG: restriction endonuclease subunit S, partial [Pseudomonadota bacterium]|nr:restriction endonuclease subunit S [Pseudomonadota bacterium]